MIVEFFKRGTGGSKGPIDYFLGKDRDREHAKILSGDLEEVAELIDSSPYVKKYTAGCLSFFEDDLSDKKKKNLMAAFEKTLFPGLSQDQYRIVWIEHKDKENAETGEKRLELNFLIPNIEITTGKRLQPFYAKADLNRVDDFKTIVNHKYQLFDPDDPVNRRSVKIAKNLPQDKKDFIGALNTELGVAITVGLVSDRESLKSWMTEIGLEITRITKNQISVKNPNNLEGKPIPLKGEFYEQNFRHTEQSADFKREQSEKYRQEAKRRYERSLERYNSLCKSKSQYHLERYTARYRTDSAELTRPFTEQENEHTSEYKYNGREPEQGRAGDGRELSYSNTELEKGLADVKRIEQSNNRASEAEKSPYFINFSSDVGATYFAYQQHVSRLYQQNKVQRIKSDQDITGDRTTEASRSETSFKFEQSRVKEKVPPNNFQGLNYEFRSPAITDYRTATTAVQRETVIARRSFAACTSTISDHKRIEGIHENFKRQAQRGSEDCAELSTTSARTVRANYLSNFFRGCRRELENTVADTFEGFSEELADREPDRQFHQARTTEFSEKRNRDANSTVGRTVERENRLSTAISRKVRSFDTGNIFEALDKLDRCRKLEQKNDRGYDSPSPF